MPSHLSYPLFIYPSPHHPELHSFPTRRSSDLAGMETARPLNRTEGRAAFPSRTANAAFRISEDWSNWCSTNAAGVRPRIDRKSTRLNSSHSQISYAVFCLKKKKKKKKNKKRYT